MSWSSRLIGSKSNAASISAQACGHVDNKMEDVSKWTQKQWNAAKAKWSEEKTKWNDCQTQAKGKSLSGHKSWKFLYDCMTK
jgi:hypothetical protein